MNAESAMRIARLINLSERYFRLQMHRVVSRPLDDAHRVHDTLEHIRHCRYAEIPLSEASVHAI